MSRKILQYITKRRNFQGKTTQKSLIIKRLTHYAEHIISFVKRGGEGNRRKLCFCVMRQSREWPLTRRHGPVAISAKKGPKGRKRPKGHGLRSGLPGCVAVTPGKLLRRAKSFESFPSFPSFSEAPVCRSAMLPRQRSSAKLTHYAFVKKRIRLGGAGNADGLPDRSDGSDKSGKPSGILGCSTGSGGSRRVRRGRLRCRRGSAARRSSTPPGFRPPRRPACRSPSL